MQNRKFKEKKLGNRASAFLFRLKTRNPQKTLS